MRKFGIYLAASVLAVTLLFGIAGCDVIEETGIGDAIGSLTKDSASSDQTSEHNPTQQTGISVVEYFNGVTPYYYRQAINDTIICESGNCPDSLDTRPYLVNEECFFCEGSSEINGDSLIAHISPVTYADMMGSCTVSDTYNYPNELRIIEKTPDRIVAVGTGYGTHEKVGEGCGGDTYKYQYQLEEKWIFTTQKLEDQSTVTAVTDAPGNIIIVPGWDMATSGPVYSTASLTITCTSPEGFYVVPSIKVTKVNGVEANTTIEMKVDKISDTKYVYTFSSFYSADYTIVGVCRTYGKNGALLNEKYSDNEIIVRAENGPKGDIPMEWFR